MTRRDSAGPRSARFGLLHAEGDAYKGLTLMVTVAAALVAGACGRALPPVWQTYEASSGWTVTYPGHWLLQEFHRTCSRAGSWIGVLVTNLDRPIQPEQVLREGSCNNSWEVRDLPDSTVIVEIRRDATTFGNGGHEANFPLRLDWAEAVPAEGPRWEGYIQPRLFLPFEYGGHGFTLNAWIASDASAADTQRLRALVHSIDFSGYEVRPQPTASSSPGPVNTPDPSTPCPSRPGSDGGCPSVVTAGRG
jgi:hypothetical protein